MYAGLGDFWRDVGDALGPAADAATLVAARIERARASGQDLSLSAALAQSVAAGELDPATAQRLAALAGTVASGAGQVQSQLQLAAGASSASRFLQTLPPWIVPAAGVTLLWLLLRR